ncbi:MAG: radical SAM protein [Anaerolineae bacterium]|nr:radical SAM protein [Anaerolineae bacterium]
MSHIDAMTHVQEIDLPEGVPPLEMLYLYIAGSCNLACRHCWIAPTFSPNGSTGPFIRLDHVRKAIDEAKSLGLNRIKLTGGEPTLHPEFRELVRLIHAEGLGITIETNGTLIDAELAQFLAEHGCGMISVSVDGATAETHDALRNVPGSYERALAGIRALVGVGFGPQLICTLHQGNVAEMAGVVELGQRLGCGSVKFNYVQRAGRGINFAEDNGFEVPEVINLYHHVRDDLDPPSRIPVYFDIPPAFRPLESLLTDRARCRIRHILGILATGEMSVCGIGTTVPELVYGHMDRDSLREVWCTHPAIQKLREDIPVNLEGICRECLMLDTCQGHCVANNFLASRRMNAAYAFCQRADDLGLFPSTRRR